MPYHYLESTQETPVEIPLWPTLDTTPSDLPNMYVCYTCSFSLLAQCVYNLILSVHTCEYILFGFTCSKTYYNLNEEGWILADSRGNLYILELKGLIDVYMLKHMFTNWEKPPIEESAVLHSILHERYVKCSYFFFTYIKLLAYVNYDLSLLCMVQVS